MDNSPEVKLVVEVPCGCVTHHLPPVVRAFQHRVLPEVVRHRDESERREEFLRQLHDSYRIVPLSDEFIRHVNTSSVRVRKQQLLDRGPLLTPHVSQDMSWNVTYETHQSQ